MILITANPSRQLLYLRYIGEVSPEQLARAKEDLVSLVATLKPEFTFLVDMTELHSMSVDCAEELGRKMDLLDSAGVGRIVRIIPDATKDIGMNILALFHYPHRPSTSHYQTLAEAAKALGL